MNYLQGIVNNNKKKEVVFSPVVEICTQTIKY